MTTAVPAFRRAWIAALFGLASGVLAYFRAVSLTQHRDFAQVWFAARAVLRGANPYLEIGPGLAFEWAAPWFYPLPAALVAVPFAPFPEHVAMGVFMGLGAVVLVWALMEHGYAPILGMLSPCIADAIYVSQWGPLFAGAFVLAPLSVVLIAKPTIGAAVFVAKPSWWAVKSGVLLCAIAFVLNPHLGERVAHRTPSCEHRRGTDLAVLRARDTPCRADPAPCLGEVAAARSSTHRRARVRPANADSLRGRVAFTHPSRVD